MVSKTYKAVLIGTTSAIALAAAMPSFAADQQAQSVVGIEEITVTARRVEENIQRVPIAITAFSPEKLLQADVKDIWNLTKQIGGVNVCCSSGNTSFTFVRGITNGAPTYFADVPANSGGFSNFFDIQNLQVLKGPQGTLFGQASNAGAFVYVPKKPGNKLGGYLTVSGGNFSRREIQAGLDVPIVEDRVLFRMAAQSFYRAGFVKDITNQNEYGDQNYYILRPSLTLKITDEIENYTLFQYTKSKGRQIPFVIQDFNFSPTSQLSILGTEALFNGGNRANFDALRASVLATQLALGPYKINGLSTGCATTGGPAIYGIGTNPNGLGSLTNLNYPRVACLNNWSRDYLIVNTSTWNFADDWSVKNIASLNRGKTFTSPGDTDGTPLLLFDGGDPKNNTLNTVAPTWSDEIQFHGKLFEVLDLTVGTFHLARYSYPKPTYALQFGSIESASTNKQSNYSRAVYGQGNLDLGDVLEGLTFTGGARYTWDRTQTQSWTLNPATLVTTAITGGHYFAPGTYVVVTNGNAARATAATAGAILCGINDSHCVNPAGFAKYKNLSYTAGFQYQYSPDTMFYVTNSRGFSSGGLQNVVGAEQFSPDVLNNVEGGVKSTFEFAGMKGRANASYYYGWFDNIKVSVTRLITDPVTLQQNLRVTTQNAATAHLQGLDADITLLPTDYLEVGGFIAYTRAKYSNFPFTRIITAAGPGNVPPAVTETINLTSTPFSFTPRIKYSLRGTYHFPMDQAKWGDISVGANYTHTGLMFTSALPTIPTDPTNINTGVVCRIARTTANGYPAIVADGKNANRECVEPHHNLDLNLDWKDILGHDGLIATFAITNVTKNLVNEGGCYCNVALGLQAPAPQVPRMFSIKLQYNF